MKEIDFLPTWYKNGRQRRISYRTQYAGLGGIFVAILVWNFVATHSLSRAEAELAQAEIESASVKSAGQEFAEIKSETAQLQEKARTIEAIDSRINVANVLAEISFLVDKKIVLSKVEFIAEKFGNRWEEKTSSRSAVRAASGNIGSKESSLPGDVRFKVLINGVASDGGGVATLICNLEDSPYFSQVTPLFTRNKEMKTTAGAGGEKFQVSEFEISCNLANYRQEEFYSAAADELTEEAQKEKAAGL
ncbi:MAG: PilN domain-containing protein [Phycisphaerae bacterium]|nr:PilN domain-containing protein [Phycisphaerae bacterium]MDD5381253.1 PilN domain-containing protein [Phycisphaerae bacterium]